MSGALDVQYTDWLSSRRTTKIPTSNAESDFAMSQISLREAGSPRSIQGAPRAGFVATLKISSNPAASSRSRAGGDGFTGRPCQVRLRADRSCSRIVVLKTSGARVVQYTDRLSSWCTRKMPTSNAESKAAASQVSVNEAGAPCRTHARPTAGFVATQNSSSRSFASSRSYEGGTGFMAFPRQCDKYPSGLTLMYPFETSTPLAL